MDKLYNVFRVNRRIMAAVLALPLALGLAACAGDATSPTVSLTGNYTLRTINGSPLPYQFSDGSVVVSDVLTLDPNGTFTEDVQMSDGQVVPFDGSWTSNNSAIQFTDANSGTTFSGSVSGSVLTEVFSTGATYVFQKS